MEPASNERDVDDFRRIATVRAELERRIKASKSNPPDFFAAIIRQAVDEVLGQGLMRFSIDQLDSTEKTYVGTRVEILTRQALDLGKGERADARVGDIDVDIKWSKSRKWMIGPENIGVVCLGIGTSKDSRTFSAGLFVPQTSLLSGATNRDKKYGISTQFFQRRIDWLVHGDELPPNFFESLPSAIRARILSQSTATGRLRTLAELVPERPIPRAAIVFAASGKDDPLRRIREDKSRSTPPLGEMVCLSEAYGSGDLKLLGVELERGHFYFVSRRKLEQARISATPV